MRAWLVTWEWDGDHAKVDTKIAAVLNPRLACKTIVRFTEWIYVNATFNLSEKIAYMKTNYTPYPAEVSAGEMISCGANPYLWARKVKDLGIQINESGQEVLIWKELDRSHIYEHKATMKRHTK